MQKKNLYWGSLLVVLLVSGCKDAPSKEQTPARSLAETDKVIKEQVVRVNKQLLQKESDEMDFYAKMHQLPVTKTASGIRFYVYEASAKGDSIREGMRIDLDFEISLLDGTLCYSSKTEGRRTVQVDHDDVESGIHRGLKYLKRGDKAIFLIPSPLAHGLLGDMNKIPPQSPIVVDLKTY